MPLCTSHHLKLAKAVPVKANTYTNTQTPTLNPPHQAHLICTLEGPCGMRVHPMFRKLNRLERQNLIEEAMRQVSVELREYMKAEAFDIIEGHENTFNFMIPIEVTVGYEAERTDLMDP